MIETAVGGYRRARNLLMEGRAEFDAIGYRLGIAQCDVVLGHADHRAGQMDEARQRALSARAAFRELQNPRGEAACERLLAMIAIDTDDFAAGEAHANVARKLYDRLQDPWGDVEARLLVAQVALSRDGAWNRPPQSGASVGDSASRSMHDIESAREILAECGKIQLDEAEPRQHRHLTLAWLAQKDTRWTDAANEIDKARAAFGDRARCGDHTPHLLHRFAKMVWLGPALPKIDAWLQVVDGANDAPVSSQWPLSKNAPGGPARS
jgi:hypothetical protein